VSWCVLSRIGPSDRWCRRHHHNACHNAATIRDGTLRGSVRGTPPPYPQNLPCTVIGHRRGRATPRRSQSSTQHPTRPRAASRCSSDDCEPPQVQKQGHAGGSVCESAEETLHHITRTRPSQTHHHTYNDHHYRHHQIARPPPAAHTLTNTTTSRNTSTYYHDHKPQYKYILPRPQTAIQVHTTTTHNHNTSTYYHDHKPQYKYILPRRTNRNTPHTTTSTTPPTHLRSVRLTTMGTTRSSSLSVGCDGAVVLLVLLVLAVAVVSTDGTGQRN